MEAVASQPPVAPGGSVDVTPVAGGASMTALPSALKELARFFLNLSGSSSLGASGDSAGVTASAAALGGLTCPSSSAAGAATFCGEAATPAGAGVLPDASAAVPGVSGEQQRRVRSRSRGRRSRSSDGRTDRRAKKRSRRRSPSPERSSRRREKRYRSSSDSSEDERADASSPRDRCAHGGARTGGSTWDYGRPRSSSLKNFGESFVVALDISKAFDRVWHKALLAKLPAYGFTPSFCKLISSFLSNRFISVVVDGATSASFPVSSGVPQGSVLSPTLFLLFINDLLHATASDVHSFADDSNLHKSSSFQCQPSSNARSQSRLAMSSTINSDLQSISEWGTRNLVKFNTSKTQLLTISLSNTPSNYPIIFEDSEIPSLNSVNILGLQISSSLSWRDHIVQIAKSASKKLGVLFRCKQYFNSDQLFKLYTGFIRPCLEYCSHIWGSSPYTSLLDRIESKAIRLIGDPSLTSTLDPLSLRRKVASLSLFYRYYFGHCSDELATCIPPPMARPRSTRQATFAHNYCVELSNARINRFSDGFFPSTSHLWNSLPSSVFPASFNLPSFKRQVYHHLRGQMA